MQPPGEPVTPAPPPARRHDPAVQDVLRLAGVSEAEDRGILVDHADGHPVSLLEIADDDTGRTCRSIRDAFPRTGYWALRLLDPDVGTWLPGEQHAPEQRDELLGHGWRPEDFATGQDAVTLAARLDLADAPFCGRFGGRPPGAGDLVTGLPEKAANVVALHECAAALEDDSPPQPGGWELLLVPLESPWQALPHIGFASTIEAPADTGHARFQRYLWEEFGGMVTAVGPARIRIELARPPLDPGTALALANRLLNYCPDLEDSFMEALDADVDEEDTLLVVAGTLLAGLGVIRLWWD